MTAKALTNEAIAFTEKKVNMALEDIIKMSKDKTTRPKKQRVPNKNNKPFFGTQNKSMKVRQYLDSRSSFRQGALAQKRTNFDGNRFPLATEAAKNAVVAAPVKNRGFNRNRAGAANWNRPRAGAAMNRQGAGTARGFVIKPPMQQRQHQQSQQQTAPKTLDSLFASMKEQRIRTFSHQANNGGGGNRRTGGGPVQQQQRQQPWGRGQRFRNQ